MGCSPIPIADKAHIQCNIKEQNSIPLQLPNKQDTNKASSTNNIFINNLHSTSPQPTKSLLRQSKENTNNVNKPQNDTSHFKNPSPIKTQNQAIEQEQITDVDKISIKKILNSHFLFKDKTQEIINSIIDNFEKRHYKQGEYFNSEDHFYIVTVGKIEIVSDKNSVNTIVKEEETFGEGAGIEKMKKSIKIKCIQNCSFYALKGEVFRAIVQKINESEGKERLLFIGYVPIFKYLNPIQLNSVASSMYKCEFNINQRIINEGDSGESGFIIKEGIIACSKKEEVIRNGKPKDYFGENALLFNEKRSLSIFATNKTICYQISQGMLIESIGPDYRTIIIKAISKDALRNSKHGKIFENEFFFSKFYSVGEMITLENNSVGVEDKTTDRTIYIVITGDLITINNSDNINDSNLIVEKSIATRGDCFGDIQLKINKPYDNEVRCKGECRIMRFEWDKILGSFNIKIDRRKAISFFIQGYHLKRIDIFRDASEGRLIEICKMMKKEKYEPNEAIFKEGEYGDKGYLIKKGSVNVYKDSFFKRQLNEGNCFGELSLLINEPRSATIITNSNVTVFTGTQNNFNSCIDKNMFNYLTNKIALQDNFQTTGEDIYFCKSGGRGKFGTVSGVHNGKNYYAIKAVKRKEAEKQKIGIKYFIQERNILLVLDHPFIMKLVTTFKSVDNIFYMMEYVNGRVMSKYVEKREAKSIKNIYETQFYISFLFIMLDYLNSKRICHRDLKPDNIMIDEKGYIKVIDFGTSIQIDNFTSTITGTPHYISPEVLLGKGYSFSCDYWSVGIIAHKLYYNFYPFGNKATDPMDVYREVIKKDVKLPKTEDNSVNEFIKMGLKKKVTERLCTLEKAKEHEFYKDFNWDELQEFKLKPPYIPIIAPLKGFNNYTMKYVDYLSKEKENEMKRKNNFKEDSSVVQEEDERNDGEVNDKNWADIF